MAAIASSSLARRGDSFGHDESPRFVYVTALMVSFSDSGALTVRAAVIRVPDRWPVFAAAAWAQASQGEKTISDVPDLVGLQAAEFGLLIHRSDQQVACQHNLSAMEKRVTGITPFTAVTITEDRELQRSDPVEFELKVVGAKQPAKLRCLDLDGHLADLALTINIDQQHLNPVGHAESPVFLPS